jgi:hypothetical protein
VSPRHARGYGVEILLLLLLLLPLLLIGGPCCHVRSSINIPIGQPRCCLVFGTRCHPSTTSLSENRDYGAKYGSGAYAVAMRDMVKRDRNHPSVVMWSFCNEVGSGIRTYYAKAHTQGSFVSEGRARVRRLGCRCAVVAP